MSKLIKLLLLILAATASPAMAWPREDFTENGLTHVPNCPGIYIIERNGTPYYVGRSRVSIQGRLQRHLAGTGSRMVATILGGSDRLTVEFECVGNMEQVESQMIDHLGTTAYGNLRRERDPARRDDEDE